MKDVYSEWVHIPGNRYGCLGLDTVAEPRPKKEAKDDKGE